MEYELGGVKFIVHNGEIYCRYADVYVTEEVAEVEPPIVFNTDKAKEPESLKLARKTNLRTCKVCGKMGHNRKTCPQANTDYAKSVDEKQNDSEPEQALDEKIKILVREGCTLDEVLLTFPYEPAASLVTLYNGFKRIHIDD